MHAYTAAVCPRLSPQHPHPSTRSTSCAPFPFESPASPGDGDVITHKPQSEGGSHFSVITLNRLGGRFHLWNGWVMRTTQLYRPKIDCSSVTIRFLVFSCVVLMKVYQSIITDYWVDRLEERKTKFLLLLPLRSPAKVLLIFFPLPFFITPLTGEGRAMCS